VLNGYGCSDSMLPVSGFLCDITGNYDATFYIAGVFTSAAGIIYILVPVVLRLVNRLLERCPY